MVEEIEPSEVEALLETDDPPTIVDVSTEAEFAIEHIPGSVNVPLNDLVRHLGRISGAGHIVTVCPRGEASIQAVRLLSAYEGTKDARIESMVGGMNAWDGPVESDLES